MVETALAFDFSKTRMICDAFDDAWASLQGLRSDFTEATKAVETRTVLAKRIHRNGRPGPDRRAGTP
jgi:hypothetical protein